MSVRRSGVTPANLLHVKEQLRDANTVSQTHRGQPLADEWGNTLSQKMCESELNERRGHGDGGSEQDASGSNNGFDEIVDEFFAKQFPVAQLVYESPAVSACTRFLLEFIKHRFLQKVMRASAETQSKQEAVMVQWRERCSVKLRQVASCVALDVYNEVPPPTAWRDLLPPNCAFTLDVQAFTRNNERPPEMYITSGCLLRVKYSGESDGTWYDLHVCKYFLSSDVTSLSPEHLVEKCKLHGTGEATIASGSTLVNPMEIVGRHGASALHWGDGAQFNGLAVDSVYKRIFAREQDIEKSDLKLPIRKGFISSLFQRQLNLQGTEETNPIVLGNSVPTVSDAGMQNEQQGTPGCSDMLHCESTMYCDAIFDWWPETWKNPVAYHPTG
eukprot:1353306-Rhodomonas_salina.1